MTIPNQIPPSSNKYLDAIQWGGWRWDDGSLPGTTITYFLRDGTYGQVWLSFEEAAYRAALQSWANVANLIFVEVFNYNSADLIEDLRGSASYLGWHETPEDAFLFDGTAWGEYVRSGEGWTTSGFLVGGLGFQMTSALTVHPSKRVTTAWGSESNSSYQIKTGEPPDCTS